ncbi:Cytosolic iron-sulfur assembly component 2B [Puccinia graminis f. sp. tritici]|uniref:Cytosolic iron-sulfur assembly component 2B n=1 Tax=Puccinia graminis f. sp. tritici TaxID=56615 RepID=A0A5B0M646_PUCGR|nr:Cytosolic iron-sulfur assembly component 2B [Puccinia graminis f. sp. tritici]KAA1125854.1 Cytosolic iron-sulfur assembly component 2B [Puccinia graminis f. sp. tritici]
MPDNANPILKSSTPSHFSSLPSSLSVLTEHQQRRKRFLGRVQEASGAQEDPYYLDSVDLLDDESEEDLKPGSLKLPHKRSGSDDEEERIDSEEIFDLIRSITDPEHPLTLEDLSVVSPAQITVSYPPTDPDRSDSPHVLVRFTPTIPHCSMATLIGLTLRVRLLRSLPARFKVDIKIKEGSHQSENSVNKQLNDKERVAAALENNHLLGVVQQCLSTAHLRGAKPDGSSSH